MLLATHCSQKTLHKRYAFAHDFAHVSFSMPSVLMALQAREQRDKAAATVQASPEESALHGVSGEDGVTLRDNRWDTNFFLLRAL